MEEFRLAAVQRLHPKPFVVFVSNFELQIVSAEIQKCLRQICNRLNKIVADVFEICPSSSLIFFLQTKKLVAPQRSTTTHTSTIPVIRAHMLAADVAL